MNGTFKNMNNYINIDHFETTRKIYRIIAIDRLIGMLESKSNFLANPKYWKDSFENFIFNTEIDVKNKKKYTSVLRNRGYGQSWTLHDESEDMWKTYSPEIRGVKIQSNIRKLLKSLQASQKFYKTTTCFIGKVIYCNNEKIQKLKQHRKTTKNSFGGNFGQAKSLLFKRNSFIYENEIRLIFLDPNNRPHTKLYEYKCDVFSLIDSITFDPRIDHEEFIIYNAKLRSIGFKGKISVSKNKFK